MFGLPFPTLQVNKFWILCKDFNRDPKGVTGWDYDKIEVKVNVRLHDITCHVRLHDTLWKESEETV